MNVFAAVDIGSNSVRLKIARMVRHRLKTIHEDRVVTRLGESVYRFGALSPEAMDATVEVLRRFHRAVQRYAANRIRVAATSALRDATNARAFVDWVHSATGWKVETISGLEEGRLIHLGVLTNTRLSGSEVLLIDLGGGSCELTVSKAGHIRGMASLPLGAVRLTQEFLPHDPPRSAELQRLRKNIAEEIDRVSRRIAAIKVSSVVATSGTAAALAGAARVVEPDRRHLKGGTVSRAAAARLAEVLAEMDAKDRARLPGIGPRRAEIVVAGAYVFAELMERCKIRAFRYSPLGLRDGILAQMLAEHDHATRSRRQIEAEREDAVLAMCRHYQVDVKVAETVRRFAVRLFQELRPVHRLPPEYETWLSTAAMLHDVGSFINRSGRHRHTYYLIANSEIFGFAPGQRLLIAAIARYQGKSRPSPSDAFIGHLSSADQEFVPRAVILLRLAKALHHERGARIPFATAVVKREKVELSMPVRGDADLALWMLQKERAYFREVFGRSLTIEVTQE
jgi:exopolyphosphatase/guanosine-5'-triphosphate,3'-diphosphate pyrophosphatase